MRPLLSFAVFFSHLSPVTDILCQQCLRFNLELPMIHFDFVSLVTMQGFFASAPQSDNVTAIK